MAKKDVDSILNEYTDKPEPARKTVVRKTRRKKKRTPREEYLQERITYLEGKLESLHPRAVDKIEHVTKVLEGLKIELNPRRAHDADGHFSADDPTTNANEAWVGGKSPKKK